MSGVSVGKSFVKCIRKTLDCELQNNNKDTCGSCFFAIMDEFETEEKDKLLWQFFLAYRGDYTSRSDKKALMDNIGGIFAVARERWEEIVEDKKQLHEYYDSIRDCVFENHLLVIAELTNKDIIAEDIYFKLKDSHIAAKTGLYEGRWSGRLS